jgi:hypothetical protein
MIVARVLTVRCRRKREVMDDSKAFAAKHPMLVEWAGFLAPLGWAVCIYVLDFVVKNREVHTFVREQIAGKFRLTSLVVSVAILILAMVLRKKKIIPHVVMRFANGWVFSLVIGTYFSFSLWDCVHHAYRDAFTLFLCGLLLYICYIGIGRIFGKRPRPAVLSH